MANPQDDALSVAAPATLGYGGRVAPAPPPPPPPPPAPTITLSSTGSATAGSPYAVTVTAANLTGPLTVTPERVSGPSLTFSPTTVLPAPGELVKLFNFTAAAAGTAVVRATAAGGIVSSSLSVTVNAAPSPPPPPPPPPPSGSPQPFTLTSATSGTLPFCLGHAFRQGDIPAGSGIAISGATAQATIKSTWPDGSARVAIIAGTYTSSGSAVSVTPNSGTASSGTALTTADLPSGIRGSGAVVGCGSFGTVSWAGSDFDTPFATWVSGHQMSSWIYRKAVGSDAHLVAWIEVRLFAGGAVEVLPWIENGYLLVASPTNKSATYTFTLGGVERFSATIDLLNHQRTPLVSGSILSHWLDTDPGVVVAHDAAYMQATRLVPTYSATVPAGASAVTSLPSDYAPLQQGSYPAGMGSAGYHGSIGLLPEWDVLYLVCNASDRAAVWRAIQRNGYSAGRYGIHFRSEATNRPVVFSSHATLVIDSSSGVSGVGVSSTGTTTPTATGGTPPTYSSTHAPALGYMAYLLTGRWYHMETTQFHATVNYLKNSNLNRNGADGVFLTAAGANTTRGAAWAIRTLGQAAAISPDGDPVGNSLKTSLTANIVWNHTRYVAQANNPQGFVQPFSDYTTAIAATSQSGGTSTTVVLPTGGTSGTDGAYVGWLITIGAETRTVTAYVGSTRTVTVGSAFTVSTSAVSFNLRDDQYLEATWMQDFYTAAFGFVKSSRPTLSATDQAKLDEFFEWKARSVVGRFGSIGPADYLYRDAAPFTISVAPSDTANWVDGTGPWHPNWGAVWTATQVVNPTGTKALGDGTLRGGNIPDATSYWGNLLPALAYAVEHGALGSILAYQRLTSAPNWAALQSSANTAPVWAVVPPVVPALPSWYPSSAGACVAVPTGSTTIGTAVRALGGNSYGGTDPDDIVEPWSGGALVYVGGQPYLAAYGGGHGDSGFNGIVMFGPLVGPGSDAPTWQTFLAPSATSAQRDDFTYTDGRQTSTHSYNNLCGVGDTIYSVRTDGNYSTGNSSPLGFKFTPAGQTSIASYPGAGNQFCATAHYDGRVYAIGASGQFDKLRIYNIAANTYSTESNADIAFSNYVGGAVDTNRGKLLVIGGPGGGALSTSAYWDLGALTRQLNVNRPPGWIYSLMFDPDRDAFVSVQSGSLVVQEANASALAAGSGATWTTRTFTGPTLPATPPNGQYGRTQYVPELKGYIHAPGLEEPVYFFRSA